MAQSSEPYPSQADHDWVGQHYLDVLNRHFPLEAPIGTAVGYRSNRDLYTDELEYSFVIVRIPDKGASAVVRMADATSAYDQIMALHRANPAATIATIGPQLKVKQWLLSMDNCAAITLHYDRFENLVLSMLSDSDRELRRRGIVTITLHPRIHAFRAHISGGRMELEITDSTHPYVAWAEATRRALDVCIAAGR